MSFIPEGIYIARYQGAAGPHLVRDCEGRMVRLCRQSHDEQGILRPVGHIHLFTEHDSREIRCTDCRQHLDLVGISSRAS